ncbi:cytochrome c oxidase subunit II [Nocardioides litoris]|uniref:aa3-type cytochrome oxidase subunit II n=1 Tax=Nocardioides litoris TaxID=1926648 RepID=UPI001FE65698|nr:cytochrome c oxidase subunit II [Nocardioides litoris]
MGLLLPGRPGRRRPRRAALVALLGLTAIVVSGCGSDSEFERLAMPKPATEEGEHTLDLWQGAWIAALVTGVVVWGLIFWAIWRYRRRHDDEVPVQTRYNLPLEIFYTIFPIIMVIVFFDHTIQTQNQVLNNPDDPVENTVYVVGQQWSWTFNYEYTPEGESEPVNVYEVGTGSDIPTLHVPVDTTTRFELRSPDVIHDFGVPAFLIKMDVIPGQANHYQVTPKTTGEYAGKCYELCGVYHSRMLFNVSVDTEAEYEAYLEQQYDAGNVSQGVICGGENASTQDGLEATEGETEESNSEEVCL